MKTVNIWEPNQIQILTVNPVDETPLGCPCRVLPAGDNYWQLSITPVTTGTFANSNPSLIPILGALSISVQLTSDDETVLPVTAAGFPIKGTVDVGPSDFLYVVNPVVGATK